MVGKSLNLELFIGEFKDKLDVVDTLVIRRNEGIMYTEGCTLKASLFGGYNGILDRFGEGISEISYNRGSGLITVTSQKGKRYNRKYNSSKGYARRVFLPRTRN